MVFVSSGLAVGDFTVFVLFTNGLAVDAIGDFSVVRLAVLVFSAFGAVATTLFVVTATGVASALVTNGLAIFVAVIKGLDADAVGAFSAIGFADLVLSGFGAVATTLFVVTATGAASVLGVTGLVISVGAIKGLDADVTGAFSAIGLADFVLSVFGAVATTLFVVTATGTASTFGVTGLVFSVVVIEGLGADTTGAFATIGFDDFAFSVALDVVETELVVAAIAVGSVWVVTDLVITGALAFTADSGVTGVDLVPSAKGFEVDAMGAFKASEFSSVVFVDLAMSAVLVTGFELLAMGAFEGSVFSDFALVIEVAATG